MDQLVTAVAEFPFDNSYARLPDRFFARVAPTRVSSPRLIRLNRPLAAELGLDADRLASQEGVAALAGNRIPDGAEPIAMAYAGHQFGGWVPQLGDGRAILLGEVVDRAGRRRDIQLKGAGRTPFSRMGDGRAPLGPVLREYIVSEAMAALGVPTTRALAAVATGDEVVRERVEPGAVLTRVAAGHVRVGTFQFFAARDDTDALRRLADHVIERHYPETAGADAPYLALLEGVIARQARLVAQWLGLGFIHGVMNTDNMAVSGETIGLWPMRLHGRLPSGQGLQLDRPRRALCLWQPAAHRPVEPGAAGPVAAAAAGRQPRGGSRGSARRRRPLPRDLARCLAGRHAGKARARHAGRRRPGSGRGPARPHGGERGRFHLDLSPSRRSCRSVRPDRGWRRTARALRRSGGVSTVGRRAGAGGLPPSRRRLRYGGQRCRPRTRSSSRGTTLSRRLSRPRRQAISVRSRLCWTCSRPLSTSSRVARAMPSRRVPEQVVQRTFCGT